jgi:hypothetical protein
MAPKTILSPHSPPILAALQCQGRSNDCGPFTTATVLNALKGLQINAEQLAQEMNKPRWNGPFPMIRRIPNWATFPWGIADELRRRGLNANWRFRAPIEDLYTGLERGYVLMPVIGSWKPLWAHVMTLLSWKPDQGWGFANTQRDEQRLDWFTDNYFRSHWNAMGRLLIEIRDIQGSV